MSFEHKKRGMCIARNPRKLRKTWGTSLSTEQVTTWYDQQTQNRRTVNTSSRFQKLVHFTDAVAIAVHAIAVHQIAEDFRIHLSRVHDDARDNGHF
jgi:hypothetical protein